MSKRYSKSNPRPPMVVARGAGWYVTFDTTSKEYSSYYSDGEYIASRATKDEAIDAIWARFDAQVAA